MLHWNSKQRTFVLMLQMLYTKLMFRDDKSAYLRSLLHFTIQFSRNNKFEKVNSGQRPSFALSKLNTSE